MNGRERIGCRERARTSVLSDFAAFLREVGLTQQQMDAAEKAMPTPVVAGADEPYCIKPSDIQGVGCFATRDTNGRIGILKCGDRWHEAGRYANHSPQPNAVATVEGDSLIVYGLVRKDEEITLNYRQVMQRILGER